MTNDPKAPKIKVFKKYGKIKADPHVTLGNRRDSSNNAVKIEWSAKYSTDELDITFRDSGCVNKTTKSCSGNKCSYLTDLTYQGDKVCKYNIILNREEEDPILVIDDN
ncbi:MAG: hypothetical protein JJE51_04100 [Thermoanaerobaculia bacterium]|nr:hypothetical protein [Thermoanaerobaculia bacterium]